MVAILWDNIDKSHSEIFADLNEFNAEILIHLDELPLAALLWKLSGFDFKVFSDWHLCHLESLAIINNLYSSVKLNFLRIIFFIIHPNAAIFVKMSAWRCVCCI